MQSSQADKADAFRAMHVRGDPVILFNIWDPGSARAVAGAGAKALATGSWSVAAAFGYDDGEQVPFALVLDNLKRIVGAADLPITADLEMGYGGAPADVGASISAALATGVVGFNIEDGLPEGGLRPIAEHSERLRAARGACAAAGMPAFLNARIDVFLQNDKSQHASLMKEAATRMDAFAAAGADGLFLPGLVDAALMKLACAATPLPVNVMASASTPPIADLKATGVGRVSYGPGPFRLAMAALETAARQAVTTNR
ncbi:MAG: isocitrate lyase/phosphoenolpyruvate mutase family protein [Parvularculaceae bacterium]|nr:isocitrate lyase/phosphoenolpyruvate mutase family protein [Parvularculaceae bacterium]